MAVIPDEQWPAARLIPISSASGVEAQERRAASALLAVMYAVPEFARTLLKPLGVPAGRVETFVEVPFKLGARTVRPDGIIKVTRSTKSWHALVETKTGAGQLMAEQIDAYLDLARELEFDALLSISNQYVSSSTDYPVEVDHRKLKKVSLHHWSWVDILTEAVVQQDYRGISDPDQAYILGELIRYLSDPRSGAVSFEGMGPSWTTVREGAREQTLRRGDDSVSAVAARWDDLVRFLALQLTKELGQDVRQVVASSERAAAARWTALANSLASSGKLYAELRVPNAAGSLEIIADLRARQVSVSTRIDAPTLETSKGRVSWLLKQLDESPDSLKIEAKLSRTSSSLASTLGQVRAARETLYPERPKEIRQFVLTATRNIGLKRDSGKGSFAESVTGSTEDFYRTVLQNLRAWKALPPKLKEPPEIVVDAAEMLDVPAEAIDAVATWTAPKPTTDLEKETADGSPSDVPSTNA